MLWMCGKIQKYATIAHIYFINSIVSNPIIWLL